MIHGWTEWNQLFFFKPIILPYLIGISFDTSNSFGIKPISCGVDGEPLQLRLQGLTCPLFPRESVGLRCTALLVGRGEGFWTPPPPCRDCLHECFST